MSGLLVLGYVLTAFVAGVFFAEHVARRYRRKWKAALAIIEEFQPELDQEERAKRLTAIRRTTLPFGPRSKRSSTEFLAEINRRSKGAA